MTRIIIKQVVWDKYNLYHIKKHNVNKEEVEDAGKKIIYHSRTYNKRYIAVGRSGKRLITIIISRKAIGVYYVVTARDAGKHERRRVYEKEKQTT